METEQVENLQVEAFDYVQYSLRRYHNHQLNGCLYMDGMIDSKSLESAVIASFQDLPQLCASFVKGKWKKTDSGTPFQIELKEGAYEKSDLTAFFTQTVLLNEAYQIKIKIFRNEGKDAIAIVLNHMLCDATAFKSYLYLLCELYNQRMNGTPVKERYIGYPRDISWVKNTKAVARPAQRKGKRERIPLHGGKSPCLIREKMPAEKFVMIKAYAKKHGVTVNDYFLAVYYLAVKKVFDYSLKTICCTADLRRYHDDKVGLCNQVGAMFCSVKNAEQMEFEELLQEVHSQMAEEKEDKCCLKQIKRLDRAKRCLPNGVFGRLVDEIITNPKVVLTNIGVIDDKKLIFGGVETEDCYITGSLKGAPNLQIVASTYKDELTFGLNILVSEKEKIKLTYFMQIYYVCLLDPVIV